MSLGDFDEAVALEDGLGLSSHGESACTRSLRGSMHPQPETQVDVNHGALVLPLGAIATHVAGVVVHFCGGLIARTAECRFTVVIIARLLASARRPPGGTATAAVRARPRRRIGVRLGVITTIGELRLLLLLHWLAAQRALFARIRGCGGGGVKRRPPALAVRNQAAQRACLGRGEEAECNRLVITRRT